jgi:plasmid stabilization system protein ParE
VRRAQLDPEAVAELREAAAWYKERSPAVARRFLGEVRALARLVASKPYRFPALVELELNPPVHRALVPGFPYALVFLVVDDVVRVLAVAHQRRVPGYWSYRLSRG